MLRVFLHIGRAELFYDSLDLITFPWQAEREEELADGLVDRQAFVLEVRSVDLEHLLVHVIWGGKVLAYGELAQTLGIEEELNDVIRSI